MTTVANGGTSPVPSVQITANLSRALKFGETLTLLRNGQLSGLVPIQLGPRTFTWFENLPGTGTNAYKVRFTSPTPPPFETPAYTIHFNNPLLCSVKVYGDPAVVPEPEPEIPTGPNLWAFLSGSAPDGSWTRLGFDAGDPPFSSGEIGTLLSGDPARLAVVTTRVSTNPSSSPGLAAIFNRTTSEPFNRITVLDASGQTFEFPVETISISPEYIIGQTTFGTPGDVPDFTEGEMVVISLSYVEPPEPDPPLLSIADDLSGTGTLYGTPAQSASPAFGPWSGATMVRTASGTLVDGFGGGSSRTTSVDDCPDAPFLRYVLEAGLALSPSTSVALYTSFIIEASSYGVYLQINTGNNNSVVYRWNNSTLYTDETVYEPGVKVMRRLDIDAVAKTYKCFADDVEIAAGSFSGNSTPGGTLGTAYVQVGMDRYGGDDPTVARISDVRATINEND